MKKRTVIISADAMTRDDLELFRQLPAYEKYFKGGAEVDRMQSIYPALTYPAHATLATGVYPDKHGILTNREVDPGNPLPLPKWFWKDIKARDIFTAAKEEGYTTASVFWTTMGNNPSIDYLVDECWLWGGNTSVLEAFRSTGSSPEVLKIIEENMPDFDFQPLDPAWHPGAERLIVSCAREIARRMQPEFMAVHISNIDGYRHKHGVFGPKIDHGIREMSDWLCEILTEVDATVGAGQYNVVMFSDHGQMEYRRALYINTLFKNKGWLTADENGKLIDWKVYGTSQGMSSYIFLKNPEDKALEAEVYQYLTELRDSQVYGIGEVFTTRESSEKYGLNGPFSFVIETDGLTRFDTAIKPVIAAPVPSDYRARAACHGYLPEKGPQPFIIAKGPDIVDGAKVEMCRMVDFAPTIAALLGVSLPDAVGSPVTEILK